MVRESLHLLPVLNFNISDQNTHWHLNDQLLGHRTFPLVLYEEQCWSAVRSITEPAPPHRAAVFFMGLRKEREQAKDKLHSCRKSLFCMAGKFHHNRTEADC